jgi:hypothetical protein
VGEHVLEPVPVANRDRLVEVVLVLEMVDRQHRDVRLQQQLAERVTRE